MRITRTLGLLTAIAMVAALGNLRSTDGPVSQAVAASMVAAPSSEQPAPTIVRVLGRDDDGTSDSTADTDVPVRLVPAIYAWDPDVRFVYFRQVSKWM